jgi:hypothetical protein
MAIESDNTEHKAAISEAEQILKDAKTSFRDSLISQEMHPEPHKPDRVQKSALNEAERMIKEANQRQAPETTIDFSRSENHSVEGKKLQRIINSLMQEHAQLIHKRPEDDEWEEVLYQTQRKIRPDLEEVQKYKVSMGKDKKGTYFQVTEQSNIGFEGDDRTVRQVKIADKGYANKLFAQMWVMNPEIPKELVPKESTSLEITKTFNDLYNKANPEPPIVTRGIQWVRNKFRNKQTEK